MTNDFALQKNIVFQNSVLFFVFNIFFTRREYKTDEL